MQTNYNRCNRQPFGDIGRMGISRLCGIDYPADHTILMMVMRNHRRKTARQPAKQTNSIFSFFAHIRLNLADKGKGDYFRGVIRSFLFRKFKYSTLSNGKYIPLSPIRPSRHLRNRNQNRIHHRHTPIRGIASFDDRLFSSVVPILFGD